MKRLRSLLAAGPPTTGACLTGTVAAGAREPDAAALFRDVLGNLAQRRSRCGWPKMKL